MKENEFFALCDALLKKIVASRHIVLSTHLEPDGDGIGAMCAFASYLKKQNKSCHVFLFDALHPRYSFLQKNNIFSSDTQIFSDADLLIVFDAGDALYASFEEHLHVVLQETFVVNIDHHATNTCFGNLNIVCQDVSSSCEIVYNMLKYFGASFDEAMATALLLGIVVDTGNFSNPATTKESLEIASVLLGKHARYREIVRSVFENQSKNTLRIWGKAFERLSLHPEWGIAVTYLLHEEFRSAKDSEIASGLSNFFNNLTDVKCSLVLKESQLGLIKGSLRSTAAGVNVASLAEYFGQGGGHKKAAGFRLKGTLREVEKNRAVVI